MYFRQSHPSSADPLQTTCTSRDTQAALCSNHYAAPLPQLQRTVLEDKLFSVIQRSSLRLRFGHNERLLDREEEGRLFHIGHMSVSPRAVIPLNSACCQVDRDTQHTTRKCRVCLQNKSTILLDREQTVVPFLLKQRKRNEIKTVENILK